MTLEGGEGPVTRPGRSLLPGKTQYSLYRRLGGPQCRSGQVRKNLAPNGRVRLKLYIYSAYNAH